ncbi:hypothetical protein N7520_000687 [Penicillium odoratum]|uniref:uncharacterized protein n=1 Tax=Penicillium odoratum TaxID=1167516 RepID=UPI002549450F|nr:uncharacterized protein N7520_000687 [Penicillium odoratum]KAJ5777441.1 hypothetical protein N7520_000687 [Penicillium odoratum]
MSQEPHSENAPAQVPMHPNQSLDDEMSHQEAIPAVQFAEVDNSTMFWQDLPELQTQRNDLEWLFEPLQGIPQASALPSEWTFNAPNLENSTIWQTETDLNVIVDKKSPPGLEEWTLAHSRLIPALNQLDISVLYSPFFEVENLKIFYDLYFENYHPHFPIFHRPTMILSDIEPLLLVSLLTLGSTMSDDMHLYELGQQVHDALRLIIINVAHGKMKSSRKNYEMAHVFHGAIVTMMKRGSVYPASSTIRAPHQVINLQLEWHQWVKEESWRRTAFFAFCMDAQHACLFGHSPILSVNDLEMTLPCKEILWESLSPESWYDLCQRDSKSSSAHFLPTLKALLQDAITPAAYSEYARFILLHGLISLQTHLQSTSRLTMGIEKGSTEDPKSVSDPSGAKSSTLKASPPWANMISTAIAAWSDCLLSLQPSLCLEAARPLYRMAQITLHVSMVDLLTLAMDPDHLGSAHARSTYDEAKARMSAWATTKSAREAVRYSLLLVQETMFSGHRYRASDDNIAPRPWCLYVAALTLWMYGVMTEGPASPEIEESKAEEYLIQMTRALKGGQMDYVEANQTAGLMRAVRDALENCRWELLQDAHEILGRLGG